LLISRRVATRARSNPGPCFPSRIASEAIPITWRRLRESTDPSQRLTAAKIGATSRLSRLSERISHRGMHRIPSEWYGVNDAHRRSCWDNARQAEPGFAQQRAVLALSSFLAARHDEHRNVEQLAGVRCVPSRYDRFDDQEPPARPHGIGAARR